MEMNESGVNMDVLPLPPCLSWKRERERTGGVPLARVHIPGCRCTSCVLLGRRLDFNFGDSSLALGISRIRKLRAPVMQCGRSQDLTGLQRNERPNEFRTQNCYRIGSGGQFCRLLWTNEHSQADSEKAYDNKEGQKARRALGSRADSGSAPGIARPDQRPQDRPGRQGRAVKAGPADRG